MNKVKKLVLDHLKKRPESQVQDIYKLLYQGVFGVGHLLTERAWEILEEEANRINLNDHADDPLLENISPDHTFIRVNLRQYLNQGYPLRSLYQVMKRSAIYKGEEKVFQTYWNTFTELVKDGVLDLSIEKIRQLEKMMEKEGVKPQHHSETYRKKYYPAYRVVLREIFIKDIENSD